jgi:hypothetical protein
MRIDVGLSREGPQVWLKFNNIFGERVVRSSSYE